MKVAVTGASGRLGMSVVEVLSRRGHDVVGVDLHEPSHRPGDTWIEADMRDADTAQEVLAGIKPEAVVHLAAIAVPFSRPEPEILSTNMSLAFNTCQGAVRAGARSVVVASSPTAIGYGNPRGWEPEYLPLDEEHPLAPWHAYGLSKMGAEMVMRMFAAQVGSRVRFSGVRPAYVIAPREWHGAQTQAGHTVRQRLDDPELAAASLFNYVDARDAGEVFHALLEPPPDLPNGEVFIAHAPDALAREPLSRLLPRFHPGTERAARALGGSTPAFSNEKAKRLLGWRPRYSWRTELPAV